MKTQKMKKFLLLTLFLPLFHFAQVGPNITSWKLNTTNHIAAYYGSNSVTVISTGDTSEVQQVCYDTDTVWVRANILASYTMGPWPGDPFVVNGQDNSYIFPRNPAYPSSSHPSVPVGMLGLAVNGVALYTDGDSQSYNSTLGVNTMTGQGIWNTIAWKAHLTEMDAGNAHPDPNSTYHHHHNPIMLASVTNSTAHSPIVGYAFDGNPIYGPFGYSVATSSTSPIKRMTSSWSLRSISTRTALYTGSVTSSPGPSVSTTFPLGTYIEDYGYTANSGDLDYYNGRYCVTPEYPNGTYAYFLNTDANGNPKYPNMVGPNFYGAIFVANYGPNGGSAAAPKVGKACYSPTTSLTASVSSTGSISCYGASTGSAVVTASGGSSSKSYSWIPSGGTSSVATNLSAGTYTCIVTSGTLSVSNTVTILQPTEIAFTVSSTSVACTGASTGGATLQVSGGSPAYTYSWSNGTTNQSISNVSAGTYTFKITDNKSCVKTSSITISQPTNSLTLSFVSSGATCAGGGSVDLTVSGGTSPYSYSWTNGSTTQDLSSVSAGSYTVSVTDAGGCIKTGVATVTSSAATPTLSAVTSSIACNGLSTGSINLSVSGSTAYTFNWSNSATTEDIAGLAAGVYSVTVTGANGCVSTLSVSILQPSAISTTITTSNIACAGASTGSINLARTGGTAPYTYLWNNASTTQNLSNVSAGTYSVVITDANGCTKTTSATISQPSSTLVVTASGNSINCNGNATGSASLSVSGGGTPYSYLWSNSATTQNVSTLLAGVYTASVTDANGCIKTTSIQISQPTTSISITLTTGNAGCGGSSTGSVGTTVSGGSTPYTYLWNNSATSSSITSLAAGNYSVVVTDAVGCSKSASTTVSQSTASAITTTVTTGNVKCYGESTGTVNLVMGGGTPPFTFLWSNSATTRSLTNLSAGNYTVVITDTQGCTKTQTVSISQPSAALTVVVSTGSLNCNNVNTGSVGLTVSGGVSPYTYTWSNSQSSQNITSLAAGSYSALITDANSCTITASTSVSQPAAISISPVVTTVTCFGGNNGAISLSVTGGSAPYTYTWSNASNTKDISALSSGSYTLNMNDNKGCSKTFTAVVSQPSLIVLTLNTASLNCNGTNTGSIGLVVSGGVAAYSYFWNNNATSQNITGLPAGIYSVLVTDANGCSKTATATILSPSAISVTAVASNVLCNGASTGSIGLNVSGGSAPYNYLWSNSATSQNITSLAAGNYSVSITDNKGCIKTASATISQPANAILITANQNTIACNGAATGSIGILITGGTSPYSYLWSNNVTTQTVSSLSAGIYSVVVTDGAGCTKTYSTNLTQLSPINNAAAIFSVLCHGASTGSVTVSTNGGTAPYTYSWSNSATSATITSVPAGAYTYSVTDALGCVKTGTINVAQPSSAVVASLSVINVSCFGANNGTINLTVTGGTAPYTYTWNNNSNQSSLNAVGAGVYTVSIKDANNCTSLKTATITQPSSITIQMATTSLSCNGSANGSASLTVSGGISPYTYNWSNNGTTPTINQLQAGVYTATITDGQGCAKTVSISITEPSAIQASLTSNSVKCYGTSTGSVNVNVTGGSPAYTYSWSNGSTTSSLIGVGIGVYTLTIKDNLLCAKIFTTSITQPASISITGSVTNAQGGQNGSINLNVNGGTNPYTYLWSNNATTQNLSGIGGGTYTVIVTDNNGCTQQSVYTVGSDVGIIHQISSQINIFPNPINDVLNIETNANLQLEYVEVIDVTGRVIYKSEWPVRQIDMAGYNNGVYVISIQVNGYIFQKRIIKD